MQEICQDVHGFEPVLSDMTRPLVPPSPTPSPTQVLPITLFKNCFRLDSFILFAVLVSALREDVLAWY